MKRISSPWVVSALRLALSGLAVSITGCGGCSGNPVPKSATGVTEITAEVKPGADGMTNEQRNIKRRLALENDPASIKHLYVFSSMTGKCMLYSTVKGKVTSSGKRLTPQHHTGLAYESQNEHSPAFKLGNQKFTTNEVIQDDGTYGSSVEYIYWFDSRDKYRQLYPPSGCVLVLANEPLDIPANEISIRFEKN